MKTASGKKSPRILVVGCGIGGEQPPSHADAAEACDIVIGAGRLLGLFPSVVAERKKSCATFAEMMAEIKKAVAKGRSVAVLASGDALFFGAAAKMESAYPDVPISVFPNITAFQALCAKIRIPWHDMRFFSAHGRGLGAGELAEITLSSKAILYCDEENHPGRMAAELIRSHPENAGRKCVIGSNLGEENEKIVSAGLKKIAGGKFPGMSAMLLLPCDKIRAVSTLLPVGLPETEYSHENGLITSPELRAIAISKLRIGPGAMWDLGAGSGSVGIEAARLCPAMRVYSVEKERSRTRHIEENIARFGCRNVEAIRGDALSAIGKLPPPRSVFVGGAGAQLGDVVEISFRRLAKGGRIVAAAVTLETRAVLAGLLPGKCVEVLAVTVGRSKRIGSRRLMKTENTVELYVYEK